MKTVELFSGTGSFSNVAKELGHEIHRIEMNTEFEAELHADMLDVKSLPECDIIWASPPCTGFSVAAMGHCWNDFREPKSNSAVLGMKLLEQTIKLIAAAKPKYWFIENPRGMMRKKITRLFIKNGLDPWRHTITYCQYGDTRMKPTDIWTNCTEWKSRVPCSPGANCHEAAPRGSKTGTQGLKDNMERSIIPPALFHEIFGDIVE